jgi:O-antigen ligase
LLAVLWVVANLRNTLSVYRFEGRFFLGLFLVTMLWAVMQASHFLPETWNHPLWGMSHQVLGLEASGMVSVSPESTWISLMRLLSYALVFILSYQLCRDRQRASAAFAWLAIAGFAYAVFGLASYWGEFTPRWIFGDAILAPDVRSTFVNRNHFATWQGLALLGTIAWFYQQLARPKVVPYSIPQNRETRVVEFILRSWKPLLAILLMVTALVLTHSRGGFVAALAGVIALLLILDRRASSHKSLSRISVVAAIGVVSIAFYLTSEVLLDRIEHTDISNEERLSVYANITKAIEDNPLLGFGYGTFGDSFRLYDSNESPFHYDRAHNTWLENTFELGIPAAFASFLCLIGLALMCYKGVGRRHRDWVYPATGFAASVLVGVHAALDFSLQIPAVAVLYACLLGIACAQSYTSSRMH